MNLKTHRTLSAALSSLSPWLVVGLVALMGCSRAPSPELQAGADAPSPTSAPSADTASTVSEGIAAVVPSTLVNANGDPVDRGQLANKVVGLYFSAHWCPPCKQFTPRLVEFRNQHADEFEVVFVSSDRNEAAQLRYMSEYEMKWPAVKFGPALRELGAKFNVRGIPTLIILSPDGHVITNDGRMDVTHRPGQALAAWKTKAG